MERILFEFDKIFGSKTFVAGWICLEQGEEGNTAPSFRFDPWNCCLFQDWMVNPYAQPLFSQP